MKTFIRFILRTGSRILRVILPRRTHYRLERAAKAAFNEYHKSRLAFQEGTTLRRDAPPPDGASAPRGFGSNPAFVSVENIPAESRDKLVQSGAPLKAQDKEPQTGWLKPATHKKSARIDRDDLAELLAPFIGCGGRDIAPSPQISDELQKHAQKCELVLCCAFTGRHQILEKIIHESLLSDEGPHVRWMIVGSTEEDYEFIKTLSRTTSQVSGFVVENNPLGRKWQTCMHHATRYYDADLYGITGSDDIVSTRLINFIIRRHRENISTDKASAFSPAMYGTLEWLVCHNNVQNGLVPQIIKCSYDYETAFEPLGAGRFYSKAFLEKCNGLIFESDLERLLDDRGFFEVRDRGETLEYFSVEDGPLISVKGNWAQMNSINDFVSATTLTLEEFSFRGYALMGESLSDDTMRYLFRPALISPQLNFYNSSTGFA